MTELRSKATDLPSEILKAIFSHISRDTQIVCQHVCKSWHYPARQLFYSTVTVMGKRNSQLSKLIYCLESSSLAGYMVKLLRIEGDRKLVFTRQELVKLITLCPNIQELAMWNNAAYFQWLLEDKDIALNDLKTLSTLGKVSWRSNESNSYFYEAAGKFAGSIEVLQIPCSCSATIEEKYGNVFNYLQQFTRLKELTMIDGSQRYLVYFHSLLNACQGLEKLNIGLGHPLFDPTATMTAIDSQIYSIKTYPSMHELTMFLPEFSIDYFRYIIRRFVNIRKLNITINQSKKGWYENEKLIGQFMVHEYIPLVKKLESTSLVIKTNGPSYNSEFFSESMKNIVGTSSKIDSQFEIDGSSAERDDIRLNTTNTNNILYATSHCASTRDFSSGSVEFPFKGHFEGYGHHINRLEIKLSKTVKRAIDLGLIMYQCSNMEVLEIAIAQPTPKEYSWSSLLEICNGKPNIYINQGQQQQFDQFCHKKLSTLNLCGAMITPSLINSICKYVPNLQSFNLMNCSFKLSEEIMDRQLDPSRFDMSYLSLIQFTLDTSFFYDASRQHTCFKITNTGSKSSEYYILDQQAAEGDIDASFKHVSESAFYDHCTAAVDISYAVVEFVFKALGSMAVHVGKYPHQQKIKYIPFPR